MENADEKKTKHREYTDAHRRAALKYRQGRAQINVNMSKAEKERITQAAADAGQSVNQFILNKVLKGL